MVKDLIKKIFSEKGVLSGKRVLTITTIGCVIILSSTTVFARTPLYANLSSQIKSKGVFDYSNGSDGVKLDSADLKNIALSIETCDSQISEIYNVIDVIGDGDTFDSTKTDPDEPTESDTLSKFLKRKVNSKVGLDVKKSVQRMADDNSTDGVYKIKKNAYVLNKDLQTDSIDDYNSALLNAIKNNNQNAYDAGFNKGKNEVAPSNANVSITAHFCSNDASKVAQSFSSEKAYTDYKNTNPCPSSTSSGGGCFNEYHSHTHGSGCYSSYVCGTWAFDHMLTPGTYDESVGGGYVARCTGCGAYWSNCWGGQVNTTHTGSKLTCTQSTATYYARNCGHAYGEIQSLSVTFTKE